MAEIGKGEEPIRVLLFAGGGFDTALQLGVAHALLVSRGKAPDLVVGVSAGAINAAALAEILQAGGDAESDDERLRAQVVRFRRYFEVLQRAPGELFSALQPDSFQIDTQKPLEALELPIHSEQERRWRSEALASKSGLINLLNRLLGVRVSIGMVFRVVRRILGLRAAGELPPTVRGVVRLAELSRLLVVLAPSLWRLAPLVRLLLTAAFSRRARSPEGRSSGNLIFQSRTLVRVRRAVFDALVFVVLVPTWVLAALAVLVYGLWAVVRGPAWSLIRWLGVVGATLWRGLRGKRQGSERFRVETRRLRYIKPSWAALKGAFEVLARFVGWLVTWAAVDALLAAALWSALSGELATRSGLATALRGSWPMSWAALRGLVGWQEVAAVAALPVLGLVLALAVWLQRGVLLHRLFSKNHISRSLFHHHPLRQIFADLFDREYFATVGNAGSMDDIVARALDPDQPWPRATASSTEGEATDQPRRKRVEDYAHADPPIHVGVVAADLAQGESAVLPGEVRVVDALLAATAIAPVFPPKLLTIDGRQGLYIDGVNIANEPTRPALTFLRQRAEGHGLSPKAPAIHLYPVSSLPVSRPELPAASGSSRGYGSRHRSLLDVVTRALELQRLRDATLERRLTELYSRTIPASHRSAVYDAGEKTYLRAWVYPIEPQATVTANRDLLAARDEQHRRRIMAETVADGCRAALERMLQDSIRSTEEREDGGVSCRGVVARHLRLGGFDGAEVGLPGSAGDGGPGVSEVCQHCALHRRRGKRGSHRQRLRVVDGTEIESPTWPVVGGPETVAIDPVPVRPEEKRPDEGRDQAGRALEEYRKAAGKRPPRWPAPRGEVAGRKRPTINLLFGGGVFRGVHQVGVINALSEVGIRPDVVAGSSVGAITAAMAARVFADGDSAKDRADPIRRLAATYMAIDRLILTDRFADFVRTFTVRGAQTRFSLYTADRTFRRYDADGSDRFGKQMREVAAGLERLFWVSPFELLALIKALRLQQTPRAERLVRRYLQEILDRSGVGGELLGTEPLQLLIREHVLRGLDGDPGKVAEEASIDAFFERAEILFLATATNLDRGRLEVLGHRQVATDPRFRVSLLQGLLASSAFPAVFRPRRAREVTPGASADDLLADGGVMDNLPLDAVTQYLRLASDADLVEKRPETPHLLFSASLEPDVGTLAPAEARSVGESWVRILRRSGRLGYNQKLALYENAQTAMRRIFERSTLDGMRAAGDFTPLDLEVVTVRPRWLCGTFAFHPMLGFRRLDQARSIAHGCAATLHRLAEVDEASLRGWRIEPDTLPQPAGGAREWPVVDRKAASRNGFCWYRPGVRCPFSRQALTGSSLPEVTRRQLSVIHSECGKPRTHRAGDRS